MLRLLSPPPRSNGTLKPPKTMQVLALGMSRTGTKSVAAALSELGYARVYHGHDMGSDLGQVYTWRRLWERKQSGDTARHPITYEDFAEVLGDCEAVTDAPAAFFWSELMDIYPEAKIVLVERDADSWYRSFSDVCIDPYVSKRSKLVRLGWKWKLLPYNVMIFLPEIFMGYFRATTEDELRNNARTVMQEHNKSILARAQSEKRQVLRMNITDGFEPLCKFLDKPVPETPFPKGNDGPGLRKLSFQAYTVLAMLVCLMACMYVAAIIALVSIGLRLSS